MVELNDDRDPDHRGPDPFRCQGFVRGGQVQNSDGASLPVDQLPPFLRALLVTDGTVTKLIEAYFWEPVVVETLSQEFVETREGIPWVGTRSGDWVLKREVSLCGADSGKVYAHAHSLIRTERIPAHFRQALIDREIGIGVLIRDSGLESYREVMEVGLEQVGLEPGAVFRTYRIIIAGEPVILITERFPLGLYADG